MSEPHTFTLPSGLRVIAIPSASDVCYAGIALAAGTRNELPSESGMAHLVEHMTFKGTPRLTSRQILNRIEGVGGDLNAFTTKEETIYYAVCLREHLWRAVSLLQDIVFSSSYPQSELEKECEVVIDEIESYNDSPADLIYDDFEALLFPEHPLGRNILGDAGRLRAYHSSDLKTFVRRCYAPERAVLFLMGRDIRSEKVKDFHLPAPPLKNPPPAPPCRLGGGSSSVIHKSTHQAHVMLGARAYALTDERYTGLSLLNNLLGGPAMNSRLSLALRERTGLVYTVESNLTSYTDTGVWSVYFGCDHEDLQRCLRLVRKELTRLTERPLSGRTLEAARRQLKGQIGVSYDNSENVALGMAKRFLHTGHVQTREELFRQIDALTPECLHAIACEIFNPESLTTLIYK